jgi:hypothetical protein
MRLGELDRQTVDRQVPERDARLFFSSRTLVAVGGGVVLGDLDRQTGVGSRLCAGCPGDLGGRGCGQAAACAAIWIDRVLMDRRNRSAPQACGVAEQTSLWIDRQDRQGKAVPWALVVANTSEMRILLVAAGPTPASAGRLRRQPDRPLLRRDAAGSRHLPAG